MNGGGDCGRREAMGILGRTAGLAAAVHALGLAGCSFFPGPPPLEVPLSEVPEGKRVRLVWAEGPVEIVRTAGGISARSLRCTHQGCEVRWESSDRRYHCPCHGGVYDADGRVITGPPPGPLEPIPAKLAGDRVVIGG